MLYLDAVSPSTPDETATFLRRLETSSRVPIHEPSSFPIAGTNVGEAAFIMKQRPYNAASAKVGDVPNTNGCWRRVCIVGAIISAVRASNVSPDRSHSSTQPRPNFR